MTELILVKNEALYAISNLKKWMQPQHVERNLVRLLSLYPPPPQKKQTKKTKNKHLHNVTGITHDLQNLFGGNIPSCCYKEVYCCAKAD